MVKRLLPDGDVILAFIVSIIVCSPLFLVSTAAQSQLDVVSRVRRAHPNLPGNREVTDHALREIAADPQVRGGILIKTSGNNCLGHACDIICFADGKHYDVFSDWENVAGPTWNFSGLIDPARCEMIGSGPTPTPPPSDCSTCQNSLIAARAQIDQLQKDKAALIVENKRVYDQLQEWDKRLNQCLVDVNTCQQKYNNVTCSGFLGLPCKVNK